MIKTIQNPDTGYYSCPQCGREWSAMLSDSETPEYCPDCITKPYTVIGLYADNQQPWMEHVEATTPALAAVAGINKMADSSDKPDPDDLYVVEVIEGTHMGTLGNDSLAGIGRL